MRWKVGMSVACGFGSGMMFAGWLLDAFSFRELALTVLILFIVWLAYINVD